jgi:hypothetical protein
MCLASFSLRPRGRRRPRFLRHHRIEDDDDHEDDQPIPASSPIDLVLVVVLDFSAHHRIEDDDDHEDDWDVTLNRYQAQGFNQVSTLGTVSQSDAP